MGAIYHGGTKYGGIGFDSFDSIDDGSVLHTFTNGTTGEAQEEVWQATEDCILVGTLVYLRSAHGSSQALVRISSTYNTASDIKSYGVRAADVYTSGDDYLYGHVCAPVKKGQYVLVRSLGQNMNLVKAYKTIKSSPQQPYDGVNRKVAASGTDITSYTSTSNLFTAPSDGYVVVAINTGTGTTAIRLPNGVAMLSVPLNSSNYQGYSIFMPKGMQVYVENPEKLVIGTFYPLVEY